MSPVLPLEIRHCIPNNSSYFRYHFIFSSHIDSIFTRASSCINILKACTTNWCQLKKTILITYKSLIIPFYHATFIRFPIASSSMIQKFRILQNSVLRVTTGSLGSSRIRSRLAKKQIRRTHLQDAPST